MPLKVLSVFFLYKCLVPRIQGQEQEVWNKHECPMVANECHLGGYQMQLADYFSIDITHDLGNWTLNGILSLSLPSSRVEFCLLLKILLGYIPNQKKKQWAWRNIKQLCMYSAVSFLELHTDCMRSVTWIWIIRLEVECAGFYADG
jgi:hypothetical protein